MVVKSTASTVPPKCQSYNILYRINILIGLILINMFIVKSTHFLVLYTKQHFLAVATPPTPLPSSGREISKCCLSLLTQISFHVAICIFWQHTAVIKHRWQCGELYNTIGSLESYSWQCGQLYHTAGSLESYITQLVVWIVI